MKRFLFFISINLAFVFVSEGEEITLKEFEGLKQRYSEELALILNQKEVVQLSIQGDSILATSKTYKRILYLKDESSILSSEKLYSSYHNEKSNIEAYTLVPGKRNYQKLPVNDIKQGYDENSSSFYDDNVIYSFVYPAIQSRAISVVQYDEILKDARFLSPFYFQSTFPVISAEFIIRADKDINFDISYFNGADTISNLKKVEKGKYIEYTFTANEVPKYKIEANSPSFQYMAPHVYARITSFQSTDGQQHALLKDASSLHKWYRTFVGNTREQSDPEVKKIVSQIVDANMDDLEKVKAIYYWVQDNIKYIAFEDGMRGFIPHPGAYVCEKRYGDCKDMASIIVNMLYHAGIDAYFTWIGTRSLPYAYTQTPSPFADNHMIATYIHNGQYYFLDATSQYAPFGLPSSMIQGKEALISFGEDKFEIVKIPELAKEKSIIKDSSTYWVENETIKGTGKVTLSGHAKVFNSFRMINSSQNKTDDYVKKLLGRGSNKFFVDDYKLTNLGSYDDPIILDYSFKTEDYFKQIGDELYINLNLDKAFNNAKIDPADRKLPMKNEYKYINESISQFLIPDNYTVEYIPKNSKFDGDVFGYEIEYLVAKEKVTIKKKYYLNYLIMCPNQFDQWNQGINSLSQAYREVLVLKKEKNK